MEQFTIYDNVLQKEDKKYSLRYLIVSNL